jgi:carbamoyl-phosphate synthase/aspartate carbamoyltransferase/dihydroorotase
MIVRIPGMLDPHTHLRGLEWAHKATFASETAAALAGGYWAVFDMPNTPPTTTDPAALALKRAEIGAQAVCDWGVYFGASAADNTAAYAAAAPQVCGLKIYNNATTGTLLIDDQRQRDGHYAAWPAGKVIAVHAEGHTVEDVLALVRKYRKPTHFCHISTADELRALAAAKADGLPVSIGVCPHHLYLTHDDLAVLGPLALMKPELKTRADRDALWEGLRSGLVDIVESDHAPHTLAEKFSGQPVYGVPGLETTLPLLLLAVSEGRLSIERVTELVAEAPRRVFGVACPPNTYTEIDTDAPRTITRADLRTLCRWSPFEGMRVPGRVRRVVIRGSVAFDGEAVTAAPGSGQTIHA